MQLSWPELCGCPCSHVSHLKIQMNPEKYMLWIKLCGRPHSHLSAWKSKLSLDKAKRLFSWSIESLKKNENEIWIILKLKIKIKKKRQMNGINIPIYQSKQEEEKKCPCFRPVYLDRFFLKSDQWRSCKDPIWAIFLESSAAWPGVK